MKNKKEEASKKIQGEHANPKSLSDGRGVGSGFAYAVKSILESAKMLKGSNTGFLGVEKKVLDANDYVGSEKLNVKKREK